MPSLPATRLPSHNLSPTKLPRRSKKRLRESLKQRLIRIYLQSTGSKVHLKHNSASNLRGSASNLARPKNSVLKSLEMALDRKSAKTELPVVAEVTAIPNPTPGTATALSLTDAQGYGSPLLIPVASPTSVSFSSTATRSHTARPLSTFSALPPLRSLVASPTANISTQALETSAIPPVEMLPTQTMDAGAHRDSQPHQVSLAVIVPLAVGAGLLLLGACIIVKMCTRRTRRPRPTPSLPMLSDLDPDDQFYESKESPIFGGKERLSPLQGANGPTWTWIQYPHPTSKVSQSSNKDTNGSQETTTNDTDSCSSCQTQLTTQNPASQYSQNLTRQSFLQHHSPNILTNASNRLSVTSMSLYPPQTNIGLAIGGARETGFTADGYDITKRSKTLNKRKSQSGLEDKKCRDSTDSSIHLAYDAEVLSPVPTEYIQVQETPTMNASERRARVKSSYFTTGTYPRVSMLPSGSYSIATATKVNVAHRNSFGKDKIPLQKSNSRRQRDAQALKQALGLTSPNSESPVPTPYPDDSMIVAENKRPRKRHPSDRKPVETIPLPTPAVMESGMPCSGTLMKMEFGVSQMSLSGLALDEDEDETGRMQTEEGFGSHRNLPITLPLRTMDKPPRVPSPPSLPSLTQMGLAHNNPEAYANYRSPTYSIYGFYENDRMSSFAR